MNPSSSRLLFDLPSRYRIRVQGPLNAGWADRLRDMTIMIRQATSRQQITTLTCEVRDQAALLGVLTLLYGMGLPLLEVERLGHPPAAEDPNR